jgi:hypothetical protein
VNNFVVGKCKNTVWKTLTEPTTGRIGIAASSGRILRVEFSRQSSINFLRQLTLQDLHRPPGRNTLWPSSIRGGANRNFPVTTIETIATAATQARVRAVTSPLKMTTATTSNRASYRNR